MKIINISAKEILNSKGLPAIDCEIQLSDGSVVNASTPSGISKGKYEAAELKDDGNSIKKAIEIINNVIAAEFIGKEPHAIEMDIAMSQMDGTPNKSKFGANTILAVSMAMFRAHALVYEMELFDFISMVSGLETLSFPIPMINFVNGGLHADNNLSIQEYLVIPYGSKGIRSAIEQSAFLFNTLKEVLKHHNKNICIGEEGGIACNFDNDLQPLDLIIEAIKKINSDTDTFGLGLDIAASHLYNSETNLYKIGNKEKTADEMIDLYKILYKNYNLFSIEDGLDQDDWQGWIKLMSALSDNVHIVADDLFATNAELINKGIKLGAANTVIIKPNQIGTITETLQAIALCKEYGLSTIVSHRSVETNDTFIVDLTVGSNCNYIKCGGLNRGERVAKYNRLLEIENILSESISG